jgi:[ribosomal protein S5]-alanine N-acetyltransferase
MKIETSRLVLQPFERHDLEELHSLWTDATMRRFLWDDQIISREAASEVIGLSIENFATRRFGFWSVSFKDSPTLIGFCGLRNFKDPERGGEEVEIIYGITGEHCGTGLATEAAKAVLRYGFEKCELERIHAGADPPNTASFRVMEKLGMRFSGRVSINGIETDYYLLNKTEI